MSTDYSKLARTLRAALRAKGYPAPVYQSTRVRGWKTCTKSGVSVRPSFTGDGVFIDWFPDFQAEGKPAPALAAQKAIEEVAAAHNLERDPQFAGKWRTR